MKPKGWSALERSIRPSAAGAPIFSASTSSWSSSTFAPSTVPARATTSDLLYGGARALNRAMADFCSPDKRLIAGRVRPLNDAERATPRDRGSDSLRVRRILCRPATAAGDKSPTHPALDGVWARLQDANMPFMLHIGAGRIPIEPGLPQQRPGAHHRLPRRRREHPRQGLHGAAASAL